MYISFLCFDSCFAEIMPITETCDWRMVMMGVFHIYQYVFIKSFAMWLKQEFCIISLFALQICGDRINDDFGIISCAERIYYRNDGRSLYY